MQAAAGGGEIGWRGARLQEPGQCVVRLGSLVGLHIVFPFFRKNAFPSGILQQKCGGRKGVRAKKNTFFCTFVCFL
jgi:hypothetical protein